MEEAFAYCAAIPTPTLSSSATRLRDLRNGIKNKLCRLCRTLSWNWTILGRTGNEGNCFVRAGQACQPIAALVHDPGYFDARKPFARHAPTDNALEASQLPVTHKVQLEANGRRLREKNLRRNAEAAPTEKDLFLAEGGGKAFELQL